MTTDARKVRGPLYQALAPMVAADPAITPEAALDRLMRTDLGDLLRNYSHPLSSVRYTLREIRKAPS